MYLYNTISNFNILNELNTLITKNYNNIVNYVHKNLFENTSPVILDAPISQPIINKVIDEKDITFFTAKNIYLISITTLFIISTSIYISCKYFWHKIYNNTFVKWINKKLNLTYNWNLEFDSLNNLNELVKLYQDRLNDHFSEDKLTIAELNEIKEFEELQLKDYEKLASIQAENMQKMLIKDSFEISRNIYMNNFLNLVNMRVDLLILLWSAKLNSLENVENQRFEIVSALNDKEQMLNIKNSETITNAIKKFQKNHQKLKSINSDIITMIQKLKTIKNEINLRLDVKIKPLELGEENINMLLNLETEEMKDAYKLIKLDENKLADDIKTFNSNLIKIKNIIKGNNVEEEIEEISVKNLELEQEFNLNESQLL